MINVRNLIASSIEARLRGRLKPFEADDWRASAVVFAPHPDDETLGCGGVVCKKIAAGAEVRFVFVTDGAASHPGFSTPEDLRVTREQEAVEAVRRLGAPAEHATFLRFADGRAADHVTEIADRAQSLIEHWAPESVYVVHRGDPPADHVAVNTGVREAVQACNRPLSIFEYPVWYWYHWPWVRLSGDLPNMWRTTARQSVKAAGGLGLLSALNTQAYVGDVLEVKRHALSAHETQTRRPDGRADWPVLADLSRGDFLSRLTSEYEVFYRHDTYRHDTHR